MLKEIRVDFAPEHLAFSPDGRYYYQGNPDGDSISVIDMVSMTEIKRIPGLVEPLNITFTPDGTKAYIGNYGAHWVGVIDVTRHELLKRIEVGEVPGVAKFDPDRYLGEIKGVSNASISERRQIFVRGRRRPRHRRRHRYARRQSHQDHPRRRRSLGARS